MRELNLQEVNGIAGGYIGEVVAYDFALKPGVEVVGFERVEVGVYEEEYFKPGIFTDTITIVQRPIYEYYPIYDRTVTFYA